MTNQTKTGGYKMYLPTGNLAKGVLKHAGVYYQLDRFVTYIEQQPVPQVNIQNIKDKLTPNELKTIDMDKLNSVNSSMTTHYNQILADATTLSTNLTGTVTTLRSLQSYISDVKTYVGTMKRIVDNNDTLGDTQRREIKLINQRIANSLKNYQNSLDSNSSGIDSLQGSINQSIGHLNTDMGKISAAIPSGLGGKIDLSNLSQSQATSMLNDKINQEQSKMSDLNESIHYWSMAQMGAIGATAVLAIPEIILGPIGWICLAGEIVGNVEISKHIDSLKSELQSEELKYAASEAEMQIVKPYYALKSYSSYLNSFNNAVKLEHGFIGQMNSALQDLEDPTKFENFLQDIGLPDLATTDFDTVNKDLTDLSSLIDSMLADNAVSDDQSVNPNFSIWAKNDQWESMLKNPNSPFYIKAIATTQGTTSTHTVSSTT